MFTLFVYLCFIVGFVDIIRMFFKLIGFIINPEKVKKGGFLSGKFRNSNRISGGSGDSGSRYGDSDRAFYRNRDGVDGDYHGNNCDDSHGTGDIYNDRMSDITIERVEH